MEDEESSGEALQGQARRDASGEKKVLGIDTQRLEG